MIIHDDALNHLTNMEETVQLTCTSPPYYNAKAYAQWSTYDKYLQFLEDIFREVFRVTEQGRMCAVNFCLLYTSPSPRDNLPSRMPSSA